jgi:WD40 repeat protein
MNFRGPAREALSIAFSPPDGRSIATGDNQGTVNIWDATSGELINSRAGFGPFVFGLAFSPDGRRLASLSTNGQVSISDATRWGEKPLLLFRAHKASVRGNLAFSPDGSQLVVPGDQNTLNIWDVTMTDAPPSVPLLRLADHTSPVVGVAFSRNGRWVASGGEDNTVKLWDAKTGELLHTFRGHSSIVSRVAFSPDNEQLASASFDKTIKIWRLASILQNASKKPFRTTTESME